MPSPFLDGLSIINLLGIVQGIFLAVTFLSIRRGNRTANRMLGLLLLGMALIILEIFLCYTGYIQHVPFLINVTEGVVFWIGPLSYFYTLSLTRSSFKWHRRYWMHLIPGILQLVGRIPFFLQSPAFKIQDVAGAFHQSIPESERVGAQPIWWFPEYDYLHGFWLDVFSFSSLLIYHTASLWLILKYTQSRQEPFWHASALSLRALPRLMALFMVFLVAAILFTFTTEDDLGDIYIATSSSVIFYAISSYFIIQARLLENDVDTQSPPRRKYEKSSLAPEIANTLKERLLLYMEAQKPYLDNGLTMPQLAENLKTSSHHLSQIINDQLGLNFSDFVNQYRIAAIKEKLTSPQWSHLKIEEIAYETGFNSKSTFQAAFKKFAGTTPSDYRKKVVVD